MKYKPTQIYLDPEDHARLKDEARRRGMSLASLLRELVSAHVREGAREYRAKTWESFAGAGGSSEDTDAALISDYAAEAADALYAKKMGIRQASTPSRRRK